MHPYTAPCPHRHCCCGYAHPAPFRVPWSPWHPQLVHVPYPVPVLVPVPAPVPDSRTLAAAARDRQAVNALAGR